ncbi:MAG: AAA family ATPase [Planctomycetaceae bacterium]|mgnify:FL=1|nr:AAA family ATPase [Planctomycetaceae bacterium]
MAQEEQQPDNTQTPEVNSPQLETGTYEIIRNRLKSFAGELRDRLTSLNGARKDVFGSIETTLLGTERVTTEHNCVPRDIIAIGEQFIFGYNIHFGLRQTTHPNDVFAVYTFRDGTFHAEVSDLLSEPQFARDFQEIYKYYKDAEFTKFFTIGPFLYMTFRVGKGTNDYKSLKWKIEGKKLTYVDNRSDHEVKFPSQHDFPWRRATRDQFEEGSHPHVSIDDRLFVETTGGDLTIKIENNTDSGKGVYSEPVSNLDQTLDDAEILYAVNGSLILVKIRPYQEDVYRYFIYNDKIKKVWRCDSIEESCVLLPDDHGVIFANGYALATGEYKVFDTELQHMKFDRRLDAPNGEDYLYVFYCEDTGTYVLLRYNLIQQEVDTPVICNGTSFFHAGEMICFRAQADPQKHHALQIWQTPYVSEDYIPETNTDSFLFKIGNRDLVRGMAECYEVISLIEKDDSYSGLYTDLVKAAGDVVDGFFWSTNEECFDVAAPLLEIRQAAESAIDEFEKVVRVKQNTLDQTHEVEARVTEILRVVQNSRFDNIDEFVQALAELRTVRGEIISLREMRYSDSELIDQLEEQVAESNNRLSQRCIEFLLRDDALAPYAKRVDGQTAAIPELTKVTDAKTLEDEISASASELEMLIDIVSNLEIDDATQRTRIIENISAIFGKVNTARASLKGKVKDLMSVEGIAEFNSQMKLLNQAVVNYLDICDTPQKCEEFLTKMMIQLEELEGRFAEFDEFVVQLTDKREEIYNAFETRKVSLVEERNRRATALMNAADRILKGVKSRVDSLESVNEINAYFASDLMIEKIRDLVDQLKQLDDSVKVDDIQSRLKTVREDAVRQLKDRQELFVDGENIIKFGKHNFSVNIQSLDLTSVLRDGEMFYHLTGTDFFEQIADERLLATRDVWQQEVISENPNVYRGEYLAYKMFAELHDNAETSLEAFSTLDDQQRVVELQKFMGPRYTEAYAKGVHDLDAAKIVKTLADMELSIGLLRYHTKARALARLYWEYFGEAAQKSLLQSRLNGVGTIAQLFPSSAEQQQYVAVIEPLLAEFAEATGLFSEDYLSQAANYLFEELTVSNQFVISRKSAELYDAFNRHLKQNSFVDKFKTSVMKLAKSPLERFILLRDWLEAFLLDTSQDSTADDYVDELAVMLMKGSLDKKNVVDGTVEQTINNMVGNHSVIEDKAYQFNYNDFITRMERFERIVVPKYRNYIDIKKEVIDQAKADLRLDEYRPRVLTSFVRNRLIDEVYLPLVGDNLAKQIGVVGDQKRTDLMGLLLLISPPGYGKTTLMEYVANRLGIIFMKINGPAIGHAVTSLDPEEAPNAGAREEVEKLNLSLEMGDNVMIYLDDIQHCNPEFLQKFISLCDAQRKIEGVYKGQSKTYDLRGRKVCVIMAGNPYTESGEKFQIPDMLANRADIYNLGEIIGDTREAFEMSYLENCLTSNPILNKLATRSQKDVYSIIRIAQTDSQEGVEFEANYSMEEVSEMVSTMKKLMRVRDVVLQVNREYINSAAQADDYRTEPSFKLQGSYRNMNRIAEKVLPIMNDEELETLIKSSYENDAQTLTSDAEANLLKLYEMCGWIDQEQTARWNDIKKAFVKNIKLRGVGSDDQFGQVVLQMQGFADGLDEIRDTISDGVKSLATTKTEPVVVESPTTEGIDGAGETADALMSLAEELRAYTTGAITVDESKGVQRVAVMHKVPKSILTVLENQFQVMNEWMRPMMESQHTSTQTVEKLSQSVEQCLQSYNKLITDLKGDGDEINAED